MLEQSDGAIRDRQSRYTVNTRWKTQNEDKQNRIANQGNRLNPSIGQMDIPVASINETVCHEISDILMFVCIFL